MPLVAGAFVAVPLVAVPLVAGALVAVPLSGRTVRRGAPVVAAPLVRGGAGVPVGGGRGRQETCCRRGPCQREVVKRMLVAAGRRAARGITDGRITTRGITDRGSAARRVAARGITDVAAPLVAGPLAASPPAAPVPSQHVAACAARTGCANVAAGRAGATVAACAARAASRCTSAMVIGPSITSGPVWVMIEP